MIIRIYNFKFKTCDNSISRGQISSQNRPRKLQQNRFQATVYVHGMAKVKMVAVAECLQQKVFCFPA